MALWSILLVPTQGRITMQPCYGVSGLEHQLRVITHQSDGSQLAIYGDAAYPLRPWLITPFHGHQLTQQQQVFNQTLNPLRTCVEWGFAKLFTYFSFLNYYGNLKLMLQPIGHYVTVGTLLMNCHICVYGSEMSQFFALDPPLWTSTWRNPALVTGESTFHSVIFGCELQLCTSISVMKEYMCYVCDTFYLQLQNLQAKGMQGIHCCTKKVIKHG